MSPAVLSLLALVAAIILSMTTRINVGWVALAIDAFTRCSGLVGSDVYPEHRSQRAAVGRDNRRRARWTDVNGRALW